MNRDNAALIPFLSALLPRIFVTLLQKQNQNCFIRHPNSKAEKKEMDLFTSLFNSKPFIGFAIAILGASIFVFRTPRGPKARRTLLLVIAIGLTIAGVQIFK